MPPDSVHIGMFLITEEYTRFMQTEFYTRFPQLKHFSKKSTKVDRDTLLNILKYFDEKGLRMTCYHFNDFQWKMHEKRINELKKEVNPEHNYQQNIAAFREKIMAGLYYHIIKHTLPDKRHCKVVMCAESYMDIWQVVDNLYKLCKRDGLTNIEITPKLRKHEPMLKMADYVAGANRANEEFKLHTISRHHILKDPIKDFDLKKLFKIYPPEWKGF